MINFRLEDIDEAARQFIEATAGHTIFALYGTMGAGKTTFTCALCRQLGVTEDVVASPTFAIVNEYQGSNGPIYHFDLYRLRSLSEALDMGIDDYFRSQRPCIIEWPQLAEPLFPADALRITIEEQPDGSRNISWKLFEE